MSKIPVKEKMENSGVFLESKIKNLQTPSQELKQGLQELSKALQTTQLPSTKEINSQIKIIEELFNPKHSDLKTLESLSKKIQALVDEIGKRVASPVDKAISKEDVIFTKDFKQILEKVNLLNKPEQLLSQSKTKEIFSQDFKAVLLKAHEEVSNSSLPNKTELLKQIDKLTLQIDYHQLVSHLSNASSVYVPYSWDALEDGSISIKNTKNGKYFCDINLELKEYGELHLRLGMFEKNQLSINITTQNSEFKSMLQEGIPQLKKQLFSVGINPKDIRFLGDDTFSSYTDTSTNLQMGFEVKA
jgi:flagellar hook-length control protein FliK